MEFKHCCKCTLYKGLEEFSFKNKKRLQRHSTCKTCVKEYNKVYHPKLQEKRNEYGRANPHVNRKAVLKREYGLSLEEYDRMFTSQVGLCKICGRPEISINKRTGKILNLAVDHCHTTGNIRGLLCATCNLALGGFNDDIKRLNKAIDYLVNYGRVPDNTRESA